MMSVAIIEEPRVICKACNQVLRASYITRHYHICPAYKAQGYATRPVGTCRWCGKEVALYRGALKTHETLRCSGRFGAAVTRPAKRAVTIAATANVQRDAPQKWHKPAEAVLRRCSDMSPEVLKRIAGQAAATGREVIACAFCDFAGRATQLHWHNWANHRDRYELPTAEGA